MIAIFTVASFAMFIFAYGRLKTVEKVVTIYKEVEAKPSSPLSDITKEAVKTAPAKQETPKTAAVDFNDSDYLTDNEQLEEKVPVPDSVAEKAKEEVKADELEKAAQEGPSAAGSAAEESYEFSNPYKDSTDTTREIHVADESIPIPQLPLTDRDFEGSVDVGIREDIPLPQLPDLM